MYLIVELLFWCKGSNNSCIEKVTIICSFHFYVRLTIINVSRESSTLYTFFSLSPILSFPTLILGSTFTLRHDSLRKQLVSCRFSRYGWDFVSVFYNCSICGKDFPNHIFCGLASHTVCIQNDISHLKHTFPESSLSPLSLFHFCLQGLLWHSHL